MPDNQNEVISVTAEQLITSAAAFLQASQGASAILTALNRATYQLVGEMSGVLRLSPVAMEELQNRWSEALNSLSNSLTQMSDNLNKAANAYTGIDRNVGQAISSDMASKS